MGIFRRFVLFLLGLLLLVLIPLSLLGYWSRTTLLDTNHYVKTVGPLASEDAIQTQVTVSIMSFLDDLAAGAGGNSTATQQLIDRQYPNLRPSIVEAIAALLDSGTFQSVWESVNREAHQTLVLLLEGKAPTDDQGRVIVNLSPVFEELQATLLDNGITVLDGINPTAESLTMPLFQSEDLASSQSYVRLFDRVAIALPFITAVLVILFLWWSPKKFRGLFWLGLIIAIGMGLLYFGFDVGRDATTGSVSSDTTKAALAAIYDEVTSSPRNRVLQIGIAGIAIAAIAFIGGKMTRSRRYTY